jgi:uncharacterized membrane protein (UPF0182 family)
LMISSVSQSIETNYGIVWFTGKTRDFGTSSIRWINNSDNIFFVFCLMIYRSMTLWLSGVLLKEFLLSLINALFMTVLPNRPVMERELLTFSSTPCRTTNSLRKKGLMSQTHVTAPSSSRCKNNSERRLITRKA